jgi:holo-[acyl-carrier protein] synthase
VAILGLGVDMIEVPRIKRAIERRPGFLERIYGAGEIKLSGRGEVRYEELAGRFAVKEALLKAIKTGWRRGATFKDIAVLNEPSGAPYVRLSGRTREFADRLGVQNIHVSISHTKELAIAVVILEG